MNFIEFQEIAKTAFKKPLPGGNAQHLLAPEGRTLPDPSQLNLSQINTAGVLALFVNTNNMPHLVLIERATYRGVHSGQIAFPGGRKEDHDLDYRDTALRETEEEIGVPAKGIEVVGSFSPLYIQPSNFLVYPYAGFYYEVPNFKPQESEVAQIIQIDFNHFLKDSAIREQTIAVRGFNMKVPTFLIDGHTIWGATAMMLSELRQMIISVHG